MDSKLVYPQYRDKHTHEKWMGSLARAIQDRLRFTGMYPDEQAKFVNTFDTRSIN